MKVLTYGGKEGSTAITKLQFKGKDDELYTGYHVD